MKSLPASQYVRILSWFMMGFPVVFIAFSTIIFELNTTGIWSIVLSPVFYAGSFLWFFTGLGIRRMKKWAWYTFAFAQIVSFYFNANLLVHYSQSKFRGIAFTLAVLIQLYIWMVLRREIRVPYLFPNIKWWESGIAGMNHIPVTISTQNDELLVGQVLDLSSRGAFVKSQHPFEDFQRIKILCNENGVKIEIPGTVVWCAKSTVTHPRGIGVRFYGLDRERKKRLKQIVLRFREADHA